MVVEGAGPGGRVGVEQPALPAARHGHADGGGEPLAERPGGDLDAPGVAVLGVAGVIDPQVRSAFRSSSSIPYPLR